MNSLRQHPHLPDLPDLDDAGGAPPVDPPETGGGRPRGSAGGGHRRWLPFIALGASILAIERLTMLTLASADLSVGAYVAAAVTFLAVVLGGTFVGGTLFYRAWFADRR